MLKTCGDIAYYHDLTLTNTLLFLAIPAISWKWERIKIIAGALTASFCVIMQWILVVNILTYFICFKKKKKPPFWLRAYFGPMRISSMYPHMNNLSRWANRNICGRICLCTYLCVCRQAQCPWCIYSKCHHEYIPSASLAVCSWVSTASAETHSQVESSRHSAPAALHSCVCRRGSEVFQIKLL